MKTTTSLSQPLCLLFIALMGIVSFGTSLKVGFIWDDHEMIENNPHIKSFQVENVLRAFRGDVFDGKGDAYFRPLQTLFNMADYSIWKLNPFGYHLTNLLLHLLAACVLFICLNRIFGDSLFSLLVAVFFVVHPIVVELMLNLSGRSETMALLFTFVGLYLGFRNSWMSYAGSLFCYALACLSKESGVLLPAYVALAAWFNPSLRKSSWRYLGYVIVLCGYFYLRSTAVGAFPLSSSTSFFSFLITEFPTIALQYIRILILPFDLHSHRRMFFNVPLAIVSPVLLIGMIAVCWIKKWKLGAFAIAWFFISLAPKVPLLATNSLMLDHWAYPCAIALCLLIGVGVKQMADREDATIKNGGYAIALSFIAFWIGMAQWNIQNRNTDFKLYTWALRFPSSSHVRCNLGTIYYRSKSYEKALSLFNDALKMNPDYPLATNGKALCLWKLGRSDEAVSALSELIAKNPDFLISYLNRAVIQGGKKGIADLDFVLKKDPANAIAIHLKKELESRRH